MGDNITRMLFKAYILFGLVVPISLNAQCAASPEAIFWADIEVGSKLPDPDIDPGIDAGINPAQPANTDVVPFNAFAKFDSSVAGNARRCTAQMVTESVAMTAAHCVRDKNGTWVDYFEFHPVATDAAQDAEAVCIATLDSWVTGNDGAFDWTSDLAFILFDRPVTLNFLDLSDSDVGTIDLAIAAGFPIAVDGGDELQMVIGRAFDASDYGSEDPIEGLDTGLIVHGEPRMGVGISGGAWLTLNPDEAGNHQILGLSASNSVVAAYGPKVLACSHNLLNFAKRGCQ